MCSTMDVLYHRKLHMSNNQDDSIELELALFYMSRLAGYIAVLALLVIVFLLIMKYFGDFVEETTMEEVRETETNPLCPRKSFKFTYGTCEKELESGNGSSSSNSCSRSSSEEDLFDGNVCVICYYEQRNCFFVPCGHCATCHACAQRIFNGENKTCPLCRRFIGKVRVLFAP
ncbi:RING/U-box superfamily protein [Quillaja saponaria]|uniref:RING/U-box superfamily protein n=1 Tax=Quillaja saponaria TaxID=32244 RepID=A0AAD7KRH1_QUISA|nr:RING/U-box superfamily protein [Quillaja saponaria]